jgi:hypothetical protein
VDYDIAPALDRPVPETDAARMVVVLEWMMAVLANQLRIANHARLDRPIAITLAGPGGDRWVFGLDGSVGIGSSAAVAAEIEGWPWTSRSGAPGEWTGVSAT